jgi:transglutaminase-like putative cysteine protease
MAVLLMSPALCPAAEDAPAWVREAAALAAPKYDGKVPAVILLNEQHVVVDDNGRRTCTTRRVVRVLSREGREFARASEVYLNGTGKIREMRGWLVPPSGEIRRYGKDKTADVGLVADDVYNEYRSRLILAADDADPGSVFAYEGISEDKSIFTQWLWEFQDRLPVLSSRFVLTLPTGWRAETVTFNAESVEPRVTEGSYTWELKNLPFLELEPASPELSAIAPWLGVSFISPNGSRSAGPSFTSWADVSRFQTEIADSQQTTSDPMAEKTRALTSGGATEFDRIAGIGRYVQGVKYIAISTRLGKGGGYRPHPAAEVFAKSYGDCKDKANLMRTMLKIAGLQSYLVAIYSGARSHVRDQWPSPWQFNHMVLAVKVSAETKAPSVIEHPQLGRLLVFDPTDEMTPPGYLPEYEQDSLALVLAGDAGTLTRMPVTPPSANRVEREAEVVLDADGTIATKVREHSFGERAANARRSFAHNSRPDYQKRIERWVARTATEAAVSKVDPQVGKDGAEFDLGIEFQAVRYAQTLQGRLMMFKPAVLARNTQYPFAADKRKHPVVLDSESFSETVRVKLPAGFVVDELPDSAKLDAPFGSYRVSYKVDNGMLVFTRSLEVKAATVAAADYAQVRDFFGQVLGSEQAPVVLMKK